MRKTPWSTLKTIGQVLAAGAVFFAFGCSLEPMYQDFSTPQGADLQARAMTVPPATSQALAAASDAAYGWLKSQQDMTGNGLVDSLEDFWSANSPIQVSYTYDQAVAAIAFVLKGDLTRARRVLDQMKALQGTDGAWINSYWWNLSGEELRKHVGPVVWMVMAVAAYEEYTGDRTTYHDMAIKALDWSLTFQKSNGAVSGGLTTWFTTPAGSWGEEVWASTEHNQDIYPMLVYFAGNTPSRTATYTAAAARVKDFLDNVAWDASKNRFWGGFQFNTNAINGHVPLDVNPWGIMALGTSGVRPYGQSLNYIETANANPGTSAANPRYVHTLTVTGGTMTLYDFDWQSDSQVAEANAGGGVKGPDIWFEGSAFMSVAYAMIGNTAKADAILVDIIKKQGSDGSKAGGVPYSVLGTNNQYWKMSQQNCISSTGWLIIAIHRYNPFQAKVVGTTNPDPNPIQTVATPSMNPAPGTYQGSQSVTISTGTSGASIFYTLDGSTPSASSTLYTGPVSITATKTLRAIAVKSGMNNSGLAGGLYTIGTVVVGDYSQSATVATGGASASFVFDSQVSSLWADVHFKTSKNSSQQNIRLTKSGNRHSITAGLSPALVAGDTITWFYTYEKAGLAYDSPWFSLTVGGGTVTQVSAPSFSVPGGTYTSARTVALSSSTAGASIRYTLDGSTPTASSALYSAALVISTTTTVKAIAIKAGSTDSMVSTATYTITSSNAPFSSSVTVDASRKVLTFTFVSNVGSTWVDLHFTTSANPGQANYSMTRSGSTFTRTVTLAQALPANATVNMFFTYEKAGLAYDSSWESRILP